MKLFICLNFIIVLLFSQAYGQSDENDFFSTALALVSTKKVYNWQEDTILTIVTSMVEVGELERAFVVADLCHEGLKEQRSMSFAAVCSGYIKKGDYKRAFMITRDNIGFDFYKVAALIRVAEEFFKAGQSQWALKVVDAMDNEAGRGYILLALSNLAKEKQSFEEAFELVKKMGGGHRVSSSLKAAVVGFAEAGRFEQGFILNDMLENPHDRAQSLVEISRVLFKTGQTDKALATLDKSLKTGEGSSYPDNLYAAVVMVYIEFDFLEKAFGIAKKIKADFSNHDNIFRKIALKYEAAGDFETAISILENINNVYRREKAFVEVDLQHNNFNQSIEQLSWIQNPWEKFLFLLQLNDEDFTRVSKKHEYVDLVETLEQEKTANAQQMFPFIAEYYFKVGDKEKAYGILVKTEELAQNLDLPEKVQSLVTTSFIYRKFKENQKAVSLIREAYKLSTKDAICIVNRFGDIFSVLLEAGMPEEALKTAENQEYKVPRGKKQLQVARYYMNYGNYEKALEVCRDIEWVFYKASFLTEMGLEYIKKGKTIGQIEQQFFKAISNTQEN